jgi:hypothetical protein
MHCYDPDQTPNAQEWLALDAQERISLAEKYHRAARSKLPNVTVHAVFTRPWKIKSPKATNLSLGRWRG